MGVPHVIKIYADDNILSWIGISLCKVGDSVPCPISETCYSKLIHSPSFAPISCVCCKFLFYACPHVIAEGIHMYLNDCTWVFCPW